MVKLLTVRDVMAVIPLGKTRVTEIINSLPHINTGGKLLVEEVAIERWIRDNTVTGTKKQAAPAKPVRQQYLEMGLTENGLIPYRHSKKGA